MVNSFEIVGHRGFQGTHNENTIGSFMDAFKNGSDAIELDVHLTKDNVPVVFHDFNLSRLAGIDMNIGSMDYSDIQKISLNNSDDRIPVLSQVLEKFKDNNIYIEMKTINDEGSLCYSDLPGIVDECLKKNPAKSGKRTVISFDPLSLSDFRSLNSEVPMALDIAEDYTRWMTMDDLRELIDELGLNSVLPEMSVLGNFLAKKEYLGNPGIIPWTVNSFQSIIPFIEKINGVITDRCDLIKRDYCDFIQGKR
ncbi:glycerophosphodiester phosphodiesterase [Oxyplasma meridianum]|uniref:Glycerophosphodiester phosphodiesterase n=1 Tax=Oxyplasma meridianum TaxID=3073602 RepID=A0AAX4NIQ7_9ARCH